MKFTKKLISLLETYQQTRCSASLLDEIFRIQGTHQDDQLGRKNPQRIYKFIHISSNTRRSVNRYNIHSSREGRERFALQLAKIQS